MRPHAGSCCFYPNAAVVALHQQVSVELSLPFCAFLAAVMRSIRETNGGRRGRGERERARDRERREEEEGREERERALMLVFLASK